MMTIVSYDVSTIDKAGKVRLRKVAKTLENFAQRVQNSLFEVNVDYATFLTLKNELLKIKYVADINKIGTHNINAFLFFIFLHFSSMYIIKNPRAMQNRNTEIPNFCP